MNIQVGQAASIRRAFTQSDLDWFAALSGDDNPIHVDAGFAARTKFGRTVAHGMFLYSVVCGVLGSQLPGPGMIQVEQELIFPTATPTDEEVEVEVVVSEVQPKEGLIRLTTRVTRPDGCAGLLGQTLVRLPQAKAQPITNKPAEDLIPSISFKGLHAGQRAETQRIFARQDLTEYASLTGDTNRVFSDARFAQEAGLAGLMVPGGLLGGLFSYLLGTRLPGQGTNYLKQRLIFPGPAYVDQRLTASVEITRLRPEKQLVNLSTVCLNPTGMIVCQGEALVLVSDVERSG